MNYLKINYKLTRNDKQYIRKVVDENTIKRISTAKFLELPFRDIDIDKDKRWNSKKINAELLQSIEQGESFDKMADRLQKVTDMNKVSAIRNARTMTTSFENMGRIDGMKDMQANGVILKKQWLATNDNKTRDAHAELNGQIAEIDEPFRNMLGEIMYPGDPSADPGNIYNCRCTLTYEIDGFEPTLSENTVQITGNRELIEDYLTGKIEVIGTNNSKQTIDLSDMKLYYSSGYDVMTPAQKKLVEDFEKKYYGEFEETLLLVDKKGNQVALINGEYGKVSLLRSEAENAEIITHTHFRAPFAERGMLGGPFSVSDLNTFVSVDNLKIMRAVAPEGTYTIIKNDNFEPSSFLREIQSFQDVHKPKFAQGTQKSTVIEYTNLYLTKLHDTFRKNAKEYGYTYFLEKGVIK